MRVNRARRSSRRPRAKGRRGCAPGIPPLRCHETGSRRQAVPCRQRQLRLSPLYALRTLPRTTTINVKSNPEPHADSRQVHPVDSSFRRSAEAMRDQDGISRQFSLGYDSARVAVGGTRRTADARRDCKEAVSAAQIVSAQAAGSYLEAAIWPESGDAWSLRRAERPGDARDNRPDRRGSQPRRTSPFGRRGRRRRLTRSAQTETVLVSGEARRRLSLPEAILPDFRPGRFP